MTPWRTHSRRVLLISCFVFIQIIALGIFILRNNNNSTNGNEGEFDAASTSYPTLSTPSRQHFYLLPIFNSYAGLNNGLASLHFISYAAKEVNRVLVVDPVIHNDHAGTYSLTHCGFWFWKHICYPRRRGGNGGDPQLSFQHLFQFDPSVPVIYGRLSNDKLSNLKYCAQPESADERQYSVALPLFKKCEHNHRKEQYLAIDDHMYASGDLRATSDPLFNIHPTIFQMVHESFDRAGISLNNSIVIHKRIGDFKGHCKNRQSSCNYPLKQLVRLLKEKQLETRTDHVIFLTNEVEAFKPYVRKYKWTLAENIIHNAKNIPAMYQSDHNACAIMEMATGISSKYFIGNPFSTFSEFIGIWRRKMKLPKGTTMAEASLFGDQPTGHSSYLYQ